MRCFWDERQRLHAPEFEFFNGALQPGAEHPGRVDAIRAAIGPTEPPRDHRLAPILAVHDAGYGELLRTAHAEWLACGRSGDALPYAFPVQRLDARLDQHSYDIGA